MKKRSFLLTMIAVIFVFSFPLSSCGKKSLTMPEGTNLEFWVTYDIAGVDLTEYARADDESGAEAFAIYGHGYEPVKNDDGTVSIEYVQYRCLMNNVTLSPARGDIQKDAVSVNCSVTFYERTR